MYISSSSYFLISLTHTHTHRKEDFQLPFSVVFPYYLHLFNINSSYLFLLSLLGTNTPPPSPDPVIHPVSQSLTSNDTWTGTVPVCSTHLHTDPCLPIPSTCAC